MHALTLKNTLKNLTLLAAGGLITTMIAVPLAGLASADVDDDDDDGVRPVQTTNPTYHISSTNGVDSTFHLVERDGEMFLVLVVPEEANTPLYDDEDDDE